MEDLGRLKEICARIITNGGRGTAYLVSDKHVATCHHVVKNVSGGASVRILLGPEELERTATVVGVDPELDCALLELSEAVGTKPLPLAEAVAGRSTWDGFGFPELARGAGVCLTGTVLDPAAQDPDRHSALSLFCDMLAAGNAAPAHGFSGSPVVVDGVIVGHIKRHIADPKDPYRAAYGTVWACPAFAVRALLPGAAAVEIRNISVPEIETFTPPAIPDDHYHVFLTYRSTDRRWARFLVDRLEGVGLRVFLDQKELKPGDRLVRSLSDALAKSHAGVALVSRGWLESAWCREEGETLARRAVEGEQFRLVAIRLDDSSLPEFFANRVYLDFRDEGKVGEETKRLVEALTGIAAPPEDSTEARIADTEVQAANEFVGAIQAAVDPSQVVAIWRDWQASGLRDIRPALTAAATLIGQNEPERAFEVLATAGEGLRARQLRGLALGKAGRVDDAIAWLRKMKDSGELDAETGGLLAGRYKQRWKERGDRAALTASYQTYRETFERTGDSFNGINAATLALFLKNRPTCYRLADQVLKVLGNRPETELDFWERATVGEAYLDKENLEGAREWYLKAVADAVGRHENIATMRRQARWILEELGRSKSELDDVFPVPIVVAFAGHMVDDGDRTPPRFPEEKIGAVRTAIHGHLERLGNVHGYCTPAKGSDILFLEELLLKRNGTATVVIPFAEADFLRVSSDAEWSRRWEELKARAVQRLRIESLDQPTPPTEAISAAFDESNRKVLRRAYEYARRLDEKPRPLMVWDGEPGDGPGGTADAVKLWRMEGFEPQIIAINEL